MRAYRRAHGSRTLYVILRDALYGLAVNLKSRRTVEPYCNRVTRMHGTHLAVLDVLALEERGEHHKRVKLSRAVHKTYRNLALRVKAVLLGGGHHAAAVKSAVHRGRYPHLLILMLHAVYYDRRVGRLVMEEKPLYSNRGVVDGLIGFELLLVANLAAIAVDAKAHAV